MKKKFVIMALLLSAFCFTGFAQEVLNSEAPRYIAQTNKSAKKEYTLIVVGQVKINKEWRFKREKFTIAATSYDNAESKAKERFKAIYHGYPVDAASVSVTCESIKDNACQL